MPVHIQDGTIKTTFWQQISLILFPPLFSSQPTGVNKNILAGSGGLCIQENHDGRQESF